MSETPRAEDPTLFAEQGRTYECMATEGIIHGDVSRQLKYLGYEKPTRIQEMAIPPQCSGKDCLVQSQTGSGKTLSFAIPLLDRIKRLSEKSTRSDGAYAVVLSPTKELCLQTFLVLEKLARMMPHIVVGHVAGGDNPKKEKARIRKGLTIICATPGRLVYHLEATESLIVKNVQTLVLDEADRLLDMGFERQIRAAHQRLVVDQQNNKCQVVLVSATLTEKVKNLASWCLRSDAEYVSAHPSDIQSENIIVPKHSMDAIESVMLAPQPSFSVPTRLVQKVAIVDLKFKLICLIGSLLQAKDDKCRRVMVFFNSCSSVEFHQALFSILRWPSFEKYSQPGVGQLPRRELKRMRNDLNENGGNAVEKKEYKGEKVFTGVSVNILHGDLNTHDRAGAMADFSKRLNEHCQMRILLCTDVAARGVDISEVDLVIQADPPQQTDEYLHRIGRTARIGNDGNALLFLAPNESNYIEHLRSKCMQDVHFAKVSQKALISECQKFNPDQVAALRDFPLFLNSHIAQQVQAQNDVDIMARKAFLSSLRAYRTFQGQDLREIFNVKDLHGGHLAAAFGLTDCPKTIALSMQQRKREDFERRDAIQARHKKRRYEHNLKLRQPKEADPPAKVWMGKVEKPRRIDPKPINPVAANTLAAMEFMA